MNTFAERIAARQAFLSCRLAGDGGAETPVFCKSAKQRLEELLMELGSCGRGQRRDCNHFERLPHLWPMPDTRAVAILLLPYQQALAALHTHTCRHPAIAVRATTTYESCAHAVQYCLACDDWDALSSRHADISSKYRTGVHNCRLLVGMPRNTEGTCTLTLATIRLDSDSCSPDGLEYTVFTREWKR